MKLSAFDFELPPELIAQHPIEPRDAARLLQVSQDRLSDRSIRDLPDLLRPGDMLVVNDTKVIPARLTGRLERPDAEDGLGAKIELTLHKRLDRADGNCRWRAFARPAKKLSPGSAIGFAGANFRCLVEAKHEAGEVTLAFPMTEEAFARGLAEQGSMPLPPYIKRPAPDAADRQDYQTIFADKEGAVAAPTAGLHFTPALLAKLEDAGIGLARLTLHVGAGTFLPVKVEDLSQHRMHSEIGIIEEETARRINEARAAGGRIVAVGTTAMRLLESAADQDGHLAPFRGETDLFILPGYRFKIVDCLITNFHLPKSTLFMLVSAFCGLARMRQAYAHAIVEGYRFFSYGDACLLERIDQDP